MKPRTTVGLLILFALYIVLGMFIFNFMEEEQEIKKRTESYYILNEWIANYSNITSYNETIAHLNMVVDAYKSGALELILNHADPQNNSNIWNLENSMFFALTVVTTIGYGNQTPATNRGKIFCTHYAIVGIPLCLILLSALGAHIVKFHSWLAFKITPGKSDRVRSIVSTLILTLSGMVCVVWVPIGFFMYYQKWTYWTAFYYTIITISTIGFGDYVATCSSPVGRLLRCLWIIFGLTWFASFISHVRDKYAAIVAKTEEHMGSPSKRDHRDLAENKMRPSEDIFTDSSTQLNRVNTVQYRTVYSEGQRQSHIVT